MAGKVNAISAVNANANKKTSFGTPSLTIPQNINNIWDASAQSIKNAAKGVSAFTQCGQGASFQGGSQTSTAFQA